MNSVQVLAFIRQMLMLGGGIVAGQGYMTAGQWETAVGAVMSLLALGWSLYASRTAGVVTAASNLKEVEKIEVSSERLADKVPSDKVTT